MKIFHIIVGLNNGGAEVSLFKICKYDKINEHTVVSFMNLGKYGKELIKIGVKVYCLNIQKNNYSILKFFYLVNFIRLQKPDLVQTWMYHADLFGSLASRIAGVKNIFWNIRNSNLDYVKAKKRTIWIAKLLSSFSYWLPKKIIVCANRARKIHEDLGYCKKKMYFIPNGYDLSILKPTISKDINIRKKFKLKKNIILLGTIARFDPQKDHINLLRALFLLKSKHLDFYCVFVGPGMNNNNKILRKEIQKLNLNNFIGLMGPSSKIPEIMTELDIHILPSEFGEAWPNVVAEAMACKTPCIVTNVGDSANIVGKTGIVVPPKNPKLLSDAIFFLLREFGTKSWSSRCKQARLRVKKNFGISKMILSYSKIWNQTLNKNYRD
jgi:glycosyltransferase involved in cell wall biosynthesis